ncbi:sulfite exporter TauE/SafE family protein [Granulicella arctica]|uniref:sulfite exporter TauE/SafE family protein n=1 Tax=Granulicella arctica TaxID=940613 RepID=UPI0021DFA3F2|nr:sulfite exporter TauE/SafE family protein [Granulicella arctica]
MTPIAIAGGLALGIVIGGISGLIGIGGGAFLIPALIYFYGMSQIRAQGTSLATLLLPIGAFAFWTYYKAGHVDLKLAMLVAVGFTVGGWLGGMWAQHLSAIVLRRGFAVLLVLLAARLVFTR